MNPATSVIRNIIFDLGGVLIDLDVDKTTAAFNALELKVPAGMAEIERRIVMCSGLDAGVVSPELFRESVRLLSPLSPSDETIDAAWNAMIADFPEKRVKILQKLKQNYRVFLLSNTNVIHYRFYADRFKRDYGLDFDSLFEKAYFSFEMKLCKPSPEIYQMVLEQSSLLPEETLFIDDNADNISMAEALGINVHQLMPEQDVTDLFREGILIQAAELKV